MSFWETLMRARQSALSLRRQTSKERFFGDDWPGASTYIPENLQVHSRHFFTSETYLRQYDRADWQSVDRQLMIFAARLVKAARKEGVPLYVHTAFRSAEEQRRLVKLGRSQTLPPVAAHYQGAAVDIVHSVHHWQMSRAEWAAIGHLGKLVAHRMGLQVTWGGDWTTFYDPAHWELKGWRASVGAVFEGEPVRRAPSSILKEFAPS